MDLSQAALIWLIAGIAFFLLEMFLPGFVLFFFGLGAWATALICWIVPDIGLNGQLGLFLLFSLLSLFALRGFVKRTFFGESQDNDLDRTTVKGGESGVVSSSIVPPAEGKIKYGGTFWRAIADEAIDEGEVVTILSQDNLLMKVVKK